MTGELRLGEVVEEDVLAAHVRIHLPNIGPFMFLALINRSFHVHDRGVFGPFVFVVLSNVSVYARSTEKHMSAWAWL